MRIVSISDLGEGYPNERFIFDELSKNAAHIITYKLNYKICVDGNPRQFKVVKNDYILNS